MSAGIDELPAEASAAWDARVSHEFRIALAQHPVGRSGRSPFDTAVDSTRDIHTLEWPAFPARMAACLGRSSALRLLDWHSGDGTPRGRFRHQEEYAEWRVIRQHQQLRTVELTTELPEYWEILAGYAPARLLDLVAEFAGAATVTAAAIYGEVDPFNVTTTASQRVEAFRANMLVSEDEHHPHGPSSEFNSGRRAITCMIHRSNNLASLVRLVVSAAHPYLVHDPVSGRTRFPSGAEAIRGVGAAATDGRSSDPLVVERIVRLVTEGRTIAFEPPIGICISDVQRHELAQPDGDEVPADWFRLSRGFAAFDGRTRHQRLALELPADADFGLDDLVVRRTGERLRYGGQLAELVQLAMFVRASPPIDPSDLEPANIEAGEIGASVRDCAAETASWEQFLNQAEDGLADR